jgi:3',5'-cyclic AMP phosphodiesterase CpdA
MRTIAHISDLHFGALQPHSPDALLDALGDIAPDLVAISGDLALHATPGEFAQARAFLERIEAPIVCTPGNHDIPSRNMLERFLRPLHRYSAGVRGLAAPDYVDDEIVVHSIISARRLSARLNWAHGRVSRAQIARAGAAFGAAPASAFKALLIHHPPTLPAPRAGFRPLSLGRQLLQTLAEAGVHAVLTGHLHEPTWIDIDAPGRPAQLHAGTTLSSRHRGVPNTFDILQVAPDAVRITRWQLDGGRFRSTPQHATIARRPSDAAPGASVRVER